MNETTWILNVPPIVKNEQEEDEQDEEDVRNQEDVQDPLRE